MFVRLLKKPSEPISGSLLDRCLLFRRRFCQIRRDALQSLYAVRESSWASSTSSKNSMDRTTISASFLCDITNDSTTKMLVISLAI